MPWTLLQRDPESLIARLLTLLFSKKKPKMSWDILGSDLQ
jgi:hypothetical protein